MTRPVWTYDVLVARTRHRRGFYYTAYKLVRNDGKEIATNANPAVIDQIRARFESWARQPWGSY